MINTREELIYALSEAAELEHGLLVQYLFAAFSLKRRTDEGIEPMEQLVIADWEKIILSVAHQEMYHLANVCNLLSAIGGAPQISRPNFPQSMKKYYPFDFELERFNDHSLYRFIIFELPKGVKPPSPPLVKEIASIDPTIAVAPDPIAYNFIGELYRQIAEGFSSIPEENLFIGPRPEQDVDDWSLRLKLHLVIDRATALAAIDNIVLEGEGTSEMRDGSHFDLFMKIREEYHLLIKSSSFEPARNVAKNPQTRSHRGIQGKVMLITHQVTLKTAELFNTIYTTMLIMLVQYYSYGNETYSQRTMLRDSSRRIMSAVIRPLAEILTELPISHDSINGNAGPGFELYGPLNVANDAASRWTILTERFRQHINDAGSLAVYSNDFPALERMAKIKENLEGSLINLRSEFD